MPVAYPKPEEAWRHLLTHQPAYFAELMLVGRCGRQLAGVLKGEVNPLHLIFPEGSLSTAEHLYQDSALARFGHRIVQRALTEMVQRRPQGEILRVLELGAGTGGLTTHVLPVLPPGYTDYCFTDLSVWFLDKAQAQDGVGYAVFGKVIDGIKNAEVIMTAPTQPGSERPADKVVIKSVTLQPRSNFPAQ